MPQTCIPTLFVLGAGPKICIHTLFVFGAGPQICIPTLFVLSVNRGGPRKISDFYECFLHAFMYQNPEKVLSYNSWISGLDSRKLKFISLFILIPIFLEQFHTF